MNKTIINQYVPDYVSPPGETLLATLEELEMSQDDLAKLIGIPKKIISEIVHGNSAITNELAVRGSFRRTSQFLEQTRTKLPKFAGFKPCKACKHGIRQFSEQVRKKVIGELDFS